MDVLTDTRVESLARSTDYKFTRTRKKNLNKTGAL